MRSSSRGTGVKDVRSSSWSYIICSWASIWAARSLGDCWGGDSTVEGVSVGSEDGTLRLRRRFLAWAMERHVVWRHGDDVDIIICGDGT